MIKVLFFAQLRQELGCGFQEVANDNIYCVAELRQFLINKHPHWDKFLRNEKLLVAVNQTLVNAGQTIVAGDEVAFFPPVTGG